MTQHNTCTIAGCGRKIVTKTLGLCDTHSVRRRKGLPMEKPIGDRTAGLEESFAVRTQWNGDCLEWTGSIRDGYGAISPSKNAHRWIFEKTFGSIPDGQFVDHICCNRKCVNVNHLRLVTNKQNMENLAVPYRTNSSGARGVSRDRKGGWRVRVTHDGTDYYGGSFSSVEEANEAAIALRNKLYTHNDRDRAA